MSAARAGGTEGPPRYEIRVQGRLDARWSAWFDGLRLVAHADGTTALRGPVVDQAALHGVLQKVRDTGLPLLSVMRLDVEPPSHPPSRPNRPNDPHEETP
jgi:hypothetical protein